MPMETVVELGRRTLEAALMVCAPILLIATVVSVTVNVLQVLTSVQEMTIATVPRLLATAGAIFAADAVDAAQADAIHFADSV